MKSKLVKSMLAVLLCGALITGLCVSLLAAAPRRTPPFSTSRR